MCVTTQRTSVAPLVTVGVVIMILGIAAFITIPVRHRGAPSAHVAVPVAPVTPSQFVFKHHSTVDGASPGYAVYTFVDRDTGRKYLLMYDPMNPKAMAIQELGTKLAE